MTYMVFDLETTGLPDFKSGKNRFYCPEKEFNKYYKSRIVSVGWLLYKEDGELLRSRHAIIKSVGFVSDDTSIASHIHGITKNVIEDYGENFESVFSSFLEDLKIADRVVGHNVDFDINVLRAEVNIRKSVVEINTILKNKEKICTKTLGKGKKLTQLYLDLFGEHLLGAHNALIDSEACAACYNILKN